MARSHPTGSILDAIIDSGSSLMGRSRCRSRPVGPGADPVVGHHHPPRRVASRHVAADAAARLGNVAGGLLGRTMT